MWHSNWENVRRFVLLFNSEIIYILLLKKKENHPSYKTSFVQSTVLGLFPSLEAQKSIRVSSVSMLASLI